ncbi:MAG: nickel pincer cofactor biosynthesis protein LarC [Firmicutes bacterium]|nr:nickel pincer cofactor biosynthesis protein LarC [Bacillota bacterium]
MRVAYLDCCGGIAGDMLLAALIDAGADVGVLRNQLEGLGLGGWRLETWEERRQGLRGTRAAVLVTAAQPERRLAEILELVAAAPLPAGVRETAAKVFLRLAEAEARVHGTTVDRVHFHEVGAVDALVDVVGSLLALHQLGVGRVYCSPLPAGQGYVEARHGLLPVPAPATAELLRGVPLRRLAVEGELVTPTGAALATTLAEEFGPLPGMVVEAIGYGWGSRTYAVPGLLRVFLGQGEGGEFGRRAITVLETDIDDLNPEFFPYVDHLLRRAGALDVTLTQVLMKKGRPGVTVRALCHPEQEEELLAVLFRETTTLGVRVRREERVSLRRELVPVPTRSGEVRVKVAYLPDGSVARWSPEFEDCRALAESTGRPLVEVYLEASAEARRTLFGGRDR